MQKTPKLLSGFLAAWPLLSVISVTAFAEGNRTVTAPALCTVTLQTGDCGKVTVNSTDYTGTTDIRNKAAGRASCRFCYICAARRTKTQSRRVHDCDKMPSVYLAQVLKMRRDVIIGGEKLYNRRSVCYTLSVKLCHAVPSGGMGAKRENKRKEYGGKAYEKKTAIHSSLPRDGAVASADERVCGGELRISQAADNGGCDYYST